jgi:hypothetical protein
MKPHTTITNARSRTAARVGAYVYAQTQVHAVVTMWSDRGCGSAFVLPIADQHTLVDGGPGSSG